jgi:hypothetical protein
MKIYKINIGLIIQIRDDIYLLKSNNNKWYVEKLPSLKNDKIEKSFDILTVKDKKNIIKTLFKGFFNEIT